MLCDHFGYFCECFISQLSVTWHMQTVTV